MKKMDKKSIIIALILLSNICFITLPYTIKNQNLQRKLANSKIETKIEKSVDFYKIYEDFNNVLEELHIEYESKKTDFEMDRAYITLELKSNINTITNLLIYINKKIPNMSISSADIVNTDKKTSTIVFYIGK